MISLKLRIIREQNRLFVGLLHIISKFKNQGIRVFLFHDIKENKSDVKSIFSLSRESFELFLITQLKNGLKPMTFEELKNGILFKDNFQKGFIVSFDDANESVYVKAYPFLKEKKIPFIIFVTWELIGKPNFLSLDQLLEFSNDPLCIIGSHGCHHHMFRYLTPAEVENELIESKNNLEALLHMPIETFAFPYGRLIECSFSNISQVSKAGYLFSFSAISSTLNNITLGLRFFLPRINVDEKLVKQTCK